LGSLDHDEFGLNQSKFMIETSDISDVFMNVIDSNKLERDAGGKPVPTFPHPALEVLAHIAHGDEIVACWKRYALLVHAPRSLLGCMQGHRCSAM
jgi:hypothetical protein